MSGPIIDGTGKGNAAKVTDDNQLSVVAVTRKELFYVSKEHQQTFTLAQVPSQVVSANAEEVLCHITNISTTKTLCISHIHVCGYEGNGFVRVYGASAYASNGTLYTPVNHNLASGKVADATVYIADGSLTVTGGAQACTKALSPETPTAEISFDGSVMLGLNNSIDVRFLELAGATPTVGLCVEGFYIEN